MTEPVSLKFFTKENRADFYEAYRKIKYDVFVLQEGWEGLRDDSGKAIAREDSFDEQSIFLVASTEEGRHIGVVRAIALNHGFPHCELFEHHFTHISVKKLVDLLCTLNALAVLPSCRGKHYQVAGGSWEGPIWKLLVLSMIRYFERKGVVGAVATAGGLASARLFCQVGFYVIDRPMKTGLHSNLMTNIGLVFGSPRHVRAQRDCGTNDATRAMFDRHTVALSQYFKEREQEVLGSRPVVSES